MSFHHCDFKQNYSCQTPFLAFFYCNLNTFLLFYWSLWHTVESMHMWPYLTKKKILNSRPLSLNINIMPVNKLKMSKMHMRPKTVIQYIHFHVFDKIVS